MQYYACIQPEAPKCESHDTELEIKRHLQETVRNRELAKKSVMDRYSLEKLLEEGQADEEANANELGMTEKETQDAGKQDSDANVNRVKAGKDSNILNANRSRRKVDGKAQEEFWGWKKRWQTHLWEMWAKTRARAKEIPSYWENMRQMP